MSCGGLERFKDWREPANATPGDAALLFLEDVIGLVETIGSLLEEKLNTLENVGSMMEEFGMILETNTRWMETFGGRMETEVGIVETSGGIVESAGSFVEVFVALAKGYASSPGPHFPPPGFNGGDSVPARERAEAAAMGSASLVTAKPLIT